MKHLLSVVKHNHFGLAAKSLRISQPALSKSIQGFEAALGVKLLDRNRSGVVPTVFGDLICQQGYKLLLAQGEMLREIAHLSNLDTGRVSVVLGPYPSVVSGYPAAARLLAKHPRINITLQVEDWRKVTSMMYEEQADFGVAELNQWQADDRLDTEVLGQHCGRAFCRPGHPILSSRPLSTARILDYPWVATRFPGRIADGFPVEPCPAGHLDVLNGDFVPAVTITVPVNLASFTAGTDVLVFASLALLEAELAAGSVVPVPGFVLKTNYGFIFRKSSSLSPTALAYIAEIRAVEAEFAEREIQLADRFKYLLQ